MSANPRTAIVTGAASGIGAGVARALAEAGANVCLLDVNAGALERALEAMAAFESHVIAVTADVTAAGQIAVAVERALATFGGVDVLVNNAGIITPEVAIDELDEAVIDRVLAVNLKSQLLCCRSVVGVMKQRGYGRIVNIASRSWLGGAGIATYAASKAGVLGLTRSLALELGRHGITVNCVSPSLVMTPLFLNMTQREQEADLQKAKGNPIPRIGTVDDIAHAVRFFASDEASFITGQHLYVSGGADLLTSSPGS